MGINIYDVANVELRTLLVDAYNRGALGETPTISETLYKIVGYLEPAASMKLKKPTYRQVREWVQRHGGVENISQSTLSQAFKVCFPVVSTIQKKKPAQLVDYAIATRFAKPLLQKLDPDSKAKRKLDLQRIVNNAFKLVIIPLVQIQTCEKLKFIELPVDMGKTPTTIAELVCMLLEDDVFGTQPFALQKLVQDKIRMIISYDGISRSIELVSLIKNELPMLLADEEIIEVVSTWVERFIGPVIESALKERVNVETCSEAICDLTKSLVCELIRNKTLESLSNK